MSHVLRVLRELTEDRVTGGVLSVSGDSIRYIGNDGGEVYINFDRNILDVLRGGYSNVVTRIR